MHDMQLTTRCAQETRSRNREIHTHVLVLHVYTYPRLERKGHKTCARRNQACVFFLLYIPKLGLSAEIPTQYSETRIIARDSLSNRLKSEDPENTDSV